MPLPFLGALLLGFGGLVISYLLAPKAKQPAPPSVEDLEEPTAEAGRPIPVVHGSMEVTGLNIIYFGDKDIDTRTVKSGGKK